MPKPCLAPIACFALALLATGCRSVPQVPPPILQFAAVVDPGDKGEFTEHEFKGHAVRIGPLQNFRVKDAAVGFDAMGWPALRFEIADPQKSTFEAWTQRLLDRPVAILVDGKIVSTPVVRSALQGGGIVAFDSKHPSEEEVRALVERIRVESKTLYR